MNISEILYQAFCIILTTSTLLAVLFVFLNKKDMTEPTATYIKRLLYFTFFITWLAVYFYNDSLKHKRKMNETANNGSIDTTLKKWEKAKQGSDTLLYDVATEKIQDTVTVKD